MKKTKHEVHSATGWKYKKVNSVVEEIHEIFEREKITFVEEIAVLSWFQAEIIYNMAKHSSKDLIQEHLKLPDEPHIPRDESYVL